MTPQPQGPSEKPRGREGADGSADPEVGTSREPRAGHTVGAVTQKHTLLTHSRPGDKPDTSRHVQSTHTHTHTHTHTRTHTQTHTLTRVHTHTERSKNTHTYTHILTHMCSVKPTHTSTHIHTNTDCPTNMPYSNSKTLNSIFIFTFFKREK